MLNPTFHHSTLHKEPKLQKFKGPESDITIENWLKAYELLGRHFNWNEKDKVTYLTNYLKNEALNWYIETLNETEEWEEVKESLIERYGSDTQNPTKAMVELLYDPKLGIKKYFEEKKRLGTKAKMNKEQIISLMELGLSHEMKSYFITAKINSYSEFYRIAEAAENHIKSKPSYTKTKPNFYKFNQNKKIEDNKNITKKFEKLPPNPCKICANLGFQNRYHWAQQCYNKNKKSWTNEKSKPVNSAKINMIEEVEENPLDKIQLNL